MELTKETKEMVQNFGAFTYSHKKMAIILGVSESDIDKEMYDENSEFNKLYNQGKEIAQFKLDEVVFKQAMQGDLKAIQKYEQLKKERAKGK